MKEFISGALAIFMAFMALIFCLGSIEYAIAQSYIQSCALGAFSVMFMYMAMQGRS